MENRQIRIAFVGTGRISDWVLRGAREDKRFCLSAVHSRKEERAAEWLQTHPEWTGVKIFDSMDSLAAAEGIDAVYIGTPNSTHFGYAKTCLEAGKHVLCEKPLVTSASDARELAATARRKGMLLMEAMISTLNPNFTTAVATVPSIHPVRNYFSSYCQYSTKYEDLRRGIVASSLDPQLGGGAVRDIGIYTIYPMVTLFGMPSDVTSEALLVDTPHGPVDIGGSIRCRYNGMTANLVFSKAVDSSLPTEIAGENGNILMDEIHICRETRLVPHATPTSGRSPKAEVRILSSGLFHDEYYYEFKHFIDLIQDGCTESPVNRLDTSIAVLDIIDEFRRSYRDTAVLISL